jgi:hypothetical protein
MRVSIKIGVKRAGLDFGLMIRKKKSGFRERILKFRNNND